MQIVMVGGNLVMGHCRWGWFIGHKDGANYHLGSEKYIKRVWKEYALGNFMYRNQLTRNKE